MEIGECGEAAAPDRLWSPCLTMPHHASPCSTMPGGEFEGFPQQPTRISAAGREDPAFVAQQKSLTSLCHLFFDHFLSHFWPAHLLLFFPTFLAISTTFSSIFPHRSPPSLRFPQVGGGRQSQNGHPGRQRLDVRDQHFAVSLLRASGDEPGGETPGSTMVTFVVKDLKGP